MKKTKNAFTLIELLAVIVILAVIALIATPIILGIVEDAKKDAFLRSVELVLSSTDLDVMDKVTDSGYQYEIIEGSLIENKELVGYEIVDKEKCIIFFANIGMPEEMATLVCNNEPITEDNKTLTEIALEQPEEAIMYIEEGFLKEVYNYTDLGLAKNLNGMNGTINYDANGQEEYAIHNGVYCVMKTSDMSKAEISDYKEGECRIIIPTSEKCFAYEPVYEYEIIDVNKCIQYQIDEYGDSEDVATSLCNNEPHEYFDGETLTEYLPSNLSFAESLLESGAVSRTQLSEVFIVDYYNNEENDSNKPACPRDVVIPNSINGVSITQIGDKAFRLKEIESVVFPKSITTIRKGAFAENKLTGELDLSNTVVTIIDGNAFSGDNDENNNLITSVKFPNTLESIGSGAFSYNPIKKIDMSYTNVEIGFGAFCEHNLSKTSQEYQNISNINSDALTCPL